MTARSPKLTPAQRQRVAKLVQEGWTHTQVAAEFGINRSSVSTIARRALRREARMLETQLPRDPVHVIRHLEPAKHPFEPDSSCYDFAHDDAHCEAVMAIGGYPVLRLRRAA